MSWLNHLLVHDGAQILVLICLALNCALVGVWLVLRKMAMLANSISHTVLLGIVAAWVLHRSFGSGPSPSLGLLIICSAFVAALTTFATQFFHRFLGLQEDASIGLVFTGLFALGVVSLSWTFPHSHIGIEIIMGNADAIIWSDLKPLLGVLIINATLLGLLRKEYQLSTFDRSLAASMGFQPAILDFILMTQVTLTIMVGFRAVGSFVVLAFLVGPVLCARQLTHRLWSLIALACAIGVLSAFVAALMARGLFESAGLALSTSGLTCSLLLVIFLSIAFLKFLYVKCKISCYR